MTADTIFILRDEVTGSFIKSVEWGLADKRAGARQPCEITLTTLGSSEIYDTEQEAKEMCAMLKREGCWTLVTPAKRCPTQGVKLA